MWAKFNERDTTHHCVLWDVYDDGRRWAVQFVTRDGQYHIVNEQGRSVAPTGKLGRRIIDTTKR